MSTIASAKRIGELLIKRNWISAGQWDEALKEQEITKASVESILIKHGWLNSEQLTQALAEEYRMAFVRLSETTINRDAFEQVPLKVALHFKVMPIKLADSRLTIAISNPQDIRALDGLRMALHQRFILDPVLATEEEILQTMKKAYGMGAETIDQILSDRAAQSTQAPAKEEALEDIEQLATDASVVKLVNQLILEAHTRRATDIHLEPYRSKVRLRYRIDGVLHDIDVPPTFRQLFASMVSRIKVLSNLNLVERRLPQDGRASVKVGEEKLDLRISVLPMPAGESVVIRILPNEMLLDLEELGFRANDWELLQGIIRKPHGLVFVTGPTGSGKTTTLYGCLKVLNTERRKIITIEDPVEYEMEGISQVQVNPPIGLTFAQGLRSMLRHDPDVMMVGEVRDLETAELAIRIALTGHMVLSTLHTNDATAAMTRLMDMGIDPYLIASSVECVLAQRLVRLLCPACKTEDSTEFQGHKVYRAKGCKQCSQTGFKGRSAIYEFFILSQSIRDLVLKRSSADVIRRAAMEMGMQTMREAGEELVKAGKTTLDEVLRVTQEQS